jgi:L-alanine-DL-glutamate epimerase-like enolase superfamily enzyme
VSLVAAASAGTWVEHLPWLGSLLADPPRVEGGSLAVPDGPGHGLTLADEALRWRIA